MVYLCVSCIGCIALSKIIIFSGFPRNIFMRGEVCSMSYLYDSLRDALGGKNFTSGKYISSWSPNEVRGIVLMRDFILIADYIKSPKIVKLDYNDVAFDLQNRNRRGNLNNLLSSRQLSCLEEIYVDEGMRSYRDVIDLAAYVNSLVSSSSRLRYYGYVSGFREDMLRDLYQKALMNGSMDFTLAETLGNFQFASTNNTEWYSKYNLRPQFYGVDVDGGRLSTYFKKCESVVGAIEREKSGKIEELNELIRIKEAFLFDYNSVESLRYLFLFGKFLGNTDMVGKRIGKNLLESLRKCTSVDGLTYPKLVDALRKGNVPSDGRVQYLFTQYKELGLYDKADSKKEFKLEETDKLGNKHEVKGIYRLGERLDTLLAGMYRANSNWKLFYLMSCKRCNSLPAGKLSYELEKDGILFCGVNGSVLNGDGVQELVKFLYDLSGYSEEGFKRVCTRERK